MVVWTRAGTSGSYHARAVASGRLSRGYAQPAQEEAESPLSPSAPSSNSSHSVGNGKSAGRVSAASSLSPRHRQPPSTAARGKSSTTGGSGAAGTAGGGGGGARVEDALTVLRRAAADQDWVPLGAAVRPLTLTQVSFLANSRLPFPACHCQLKVGLVDFLICDRTKTWTRKCNVLATS